MTDIVNPLLMTTIVIGGLGLIVKGLVTRHNMPISRVTEIINQQVNMLDTTQQGLELMRDKTRHFLDVFEREVVVHPSNTELLTAAKDLHLAC